MKLKELESSSVYHQGYGAGSGEVITTVYECPCGKGTVTYEKDDIPGFRDSSIVCDCEECRANYDFGKGVATKK